MKKFVCSCGKALTGRQIGGHRRWNPDHEISTPENPDHSAPEKPKDGSPPSPETPKGTTTASLEEASIITIVPKAFTTYSSILWQAKVATEREWNWPLLSPEDWLDTFIYECMKQRGIVLGAYQVVNRKNNENQ